MLLPILVYATSLTGTSQGPVTPRSVLVFSKSVGFRHDSIPDGRAAIVNLGIERGWTVTCSEDANILQPNKLKAFDTIVFLRSGRRRFFTPPPTPPGVRISHRAVHKVDSRCQCSRRGIKPPHLMRSLFTQVRIARVFEAFQGLRT